MELIYFDGRGVVEITRIMLALSNVKYNDIRLSVSDDMKTFKERKVLCKYLYISFVYMFI